MTRSIAILLFLVLSATGAHADLDIPEKTVKAGVRTLVWTAWSTDCSRALKFPQLDAKDGMIEARRTTMKKCGFPDYPVTEYYFTSNPGFRGHTYVNVFTYGRLRGRQTSPTARKVFVK